MPRKRLTNKQEEKLLKKRGEKSKKKENKKVVESKRKENFFDSGIYLLLAVLNILLSLDFFTFYFTDKEISFEMFLLSELEIILAFVLILLYRKEKNRS